MDQLTILAPARRHQSEVARFDADVVLMDSGSSTARPTPPAPAHSALNPGKSVNAILDFLLAAGAERLIAVGHLPWIGQLAAYLRGEQGYFPFNHGMILVFDGDTSGWQMRASFQPQPVSG